MDITGLQGGAGSAADIGLALQVRRSSAENRPGRGLNRGLLQEAGGVGASSDYIDIEAKTVSVSSIESAPSGTRNLALAVGKQSENRPYSAASENTSVSKSLNYSPSKRNGGSVEVRYSTPSRGRLVDLIA